MIIAGNNIGYGHKPIVACDLSLNHGGDLNQALKMIDGIAECGADSVKVQYYRTLDFCDKNHEQYKLFKDHEISLEFVKECYRRAKERNLIFGVTTTSKQGVKQVADYADYFKIASDMAAKTDMIDKMKGYPIPKIISTGHLSLENLKGIKSWLWLHCVSDYPCHDSKLWKIKHMQELGYLTGFSFHGTPDKLSDCIRAAEMGAVWVEVHFRSGNAVDWWALDAKKLKELCMALGAVND